MNNPPPGRSVRTAEPEEWHITCTGQTFENARQDERFAYIVTLARSVNALNFVNSMMLYAGEDQSPRAARNRLNSYFFGSAIMYEALKPVRAMNQAFGDDEIFQNGLRLILRNKTAQLVEQEHLNPVRHGAVFPLRP